MRLSMGNAPCSWGVEFADDPRNPPWERVLDEAKQARAAGATRYCMGAAWRSPKARDMDLLCAMVEGVRALGLETCMTLGMLSDSDVARLKTAGLDYYNHNIDTSERYYSEVITTRTFGERNTHVDGEGYRYSTIAARLTGAL